MQLQDYEIEELEVESHITMQDAEGLLVTQWIDTSASSDEYEEVYINCPYQLYY